MTNILIVEDSPTQAARLDLYLAHHGHQPVIAADAEKALDVLATTAVDLVISDIVMPGLSGYELCRRIKSSDVWRHIPVILLTTLKDPMDIIQGLESGADNFFTKPYEPEQLIKRVNAMLENRRMAVEGKLRVGFEVSFLGRKFGISSDRQQILDLLISTFEQIVETNRELERRKEELAAAQAQIETYARELEAKVEDTEARYQAVLRNAGDAIITTDPNGRILMFNRAAEELFQISAVEAATMGVDEIISLPEGNSIVDATRLYFSRDQRSHVVRGAREVLGRRKDGTTFRFEIVVSDVSIGKDRMMCASGRDVTERRAAEAALVGREAAYRSLVNGSLQGVLVAKGGKPLFVNEVFAKMYGYSVEEILENCTTPDFYHPDERAMMHERIQARIKGDSEVRRYETRSLKKDGTVFSTEQLTSVVDWFGKSAVQIVSVDVTDRKQLEAELRQSQKMEAIGKLTGGIAHDFNNLLTVVVGNLQLLEDNFEAGSPAEDCAKSALGAAMRGADLTRRLLAFARRQVLDPETRNINDLIGGLEDLLRRTLGEDVELKLSLCADAWLTRIDPGQLDNAILNLAVNARDAMDGGGALTIETTNEILDADYAGRHAEVSAGPYVMIAVSDTGSGMPPDVIEKAFEPFFTTKPVGQGTGLGLSMVYGFIKQSGGHVKIYSELGHGTTIKLYLPAERDRTQAQAASARNVPAAVIKTGETILLVEDDPGVQEVGANILKRLGYRVIRADDGHAGYEALEADANIDLLFTDIMMRGGMSGVDLAKRAREKWPHLKVLYCSGYAENAFARTGTLEPGTMFVSKPYDRSKLASTLRKILDSKA